MRIFVNDGLRHRSTTGYGVLSRHLILGLDRLGHEVVLQAGQRQWDVVEDDAAVRLTELPAEQSAPSTADVVLQVASPSTCKQFSLPSAIYTQNALGGLPRSWAQALARADHCIVPSKFDHEVFSRYLPSVSIAPQGSNPAVFQPMPKRRSEGSERFTFFFVGAYGFRKGVDVLLSAFLQEFIESEPVELWLYCVGMHDYVNHLLRAIQTQRPLANIRVSSRPFSPAWMARFYNQIDCVVTASRGEGWCMPLTEGLLCGKPIIAPDSTGPAGYLDNSVAALLPVSERKVIDVTDPFAEGFKEIYGEPGITYFEPDIHALRCAMREVYSLHDLAAERAEAGRDMVASRYNWTSAVAGVEEALTRLIA